jgi:hypothetical protein
MIKKPISWQRCGCRVVLHMAAAAGYPDLGDVGSPHLVPPNARPRRS